MGKESNALTHDATEVVANSIKCHFFKDASDVIIGKKLIKRQIFALHKNHGLQPDSE